MTTNPQLPGSNIWFVRAGRDDVLAGHFLENGIVSMGCGIGPINPNDSKPDIVRRLAKKYPNAKAKTLRSLADEIWGFNKYMEAGEPIAIYEPQRRMCHIGKIQFLFASAELGPNPQYGHDYIHKVEWLYQIPFGTLHRRTRRQLKLTLALHRLSREDSVGLRRPFYK